MTFENLTLEREGAVALVTISRPVAAKEGSTVIVDVAKQVGSALIGLLEVPDAVSSSAFTAVALHDTAEQPSDLLIRRDDEFLAIWYRLAAGRHAGRAAAPRRRRDRDQRIAKHREHDEHIG